MWFSYLWCNRDMLHLLDWRRPWRCTVTLMSNWMVYFENFPWLEWCFSGKYIGKKLLWMKKLSVVDYGMFSLPPSFPLKKNTTFNFENLPSQLLMNGMFLFITPLLVEHQGLWQFILPLCKERLCRLIFVSSCFVFKLPFSCNSRWWTYLPLYGWWRIWKATAICILRGGMPFTWLIFIQCGVEK